MQDERGVTGAVYNIIMRVYSGECDENILAKQKKSAKVTSSRITKIRPNDSHEGGAL